VVDKNKGFIYYQVSIFLPCILILFHYLVLNFCISLQKNKFLPTGVLCANTAPLINID